MKILYLRLDNFTNIKAGLKTNSIEIDFSQSKNKIILLTGPNGSGKTSILSCLHPFAYNGNLDIRSETPLVQIGKDGYKEIHIKDNSDYYIIKHYYNHLKESHSVKSYIMKNDEELNINGNVTSFKEIVKAELDIEPDYLKLSRLGSNVTNFIDLKTSERKSFMGKILDEVEIYLKYYKKITEKMREVKSIISHTVNKISKLGINDKEELKKYQKKLQTQIDEFKESIDEINSEISIMDHELSKYDDSLIIKEKIDKRSEEIKKLRKLIAKYNDNTDNISYTQYEDKIHEIEKTNAGLSVSLDNIISNRDSLLSHIDNIMKEMHNIKNEISKLEENKDIKEQENIVRKLEDIINTRKSEFKSDNFDTEYSKEEMKEFIGVLQNCMEILLTTYEFGKKPIEKAISLIEEKTSIDKYVSSHGEKVIKNKMQSYSEYIYSSMINKIGKPRISCNDTGCYAYKFFKDIEDYALESPDIITEDETFVKYTSMAYQNITTVINKITEYKKLILKMPEEIRVMFITDNIFKHITKLENIYDSKILFNELTRITECELQKSDELSLQEHKKTLEMLKKSSSNSKYFEKKLKELENDFVMSKDRLDKLQDEFEKIKEKMNLNHETKEELYTLVELGKNIADIEKEYEELEHSYSLIRDYKITKNELLKKLEYKQFAYNKLIKEYNENEYNLDTYKLLNEELSEYNKKYEELDLIKGALSSKEGIPLLYIQIYLKNIQDITNDLLDIIYDGDLVIEDFNISADEFKIPYITKGNRVKDVSYASQGEKSFISLALSFALIYQSISRYNIMLLDEIDATLDTDNRVKFLRILEKQIEMIDADQIILISHNSMFNMYPVDVIDLKNKKDNENRLANYIEIKY